MPIYDETLTITASDDPADPLQEWQTAGANPLARVTHDGRLQVGSFDDGVMATDESLIEAHRLETDTAKPKRGFHLKGEISEVLNTLVSWVVQELTLKGASGVAALHTAFRVRLRNDATGTPMAGGDLRGGDIEVTHAGGATGSPLPSVTGLRVTVNQEGSSSSVALHGVKVEVPVSGSNVYALHTTGGKVHLGGLSAGLLSVDANGDVISGGGAASALIPTGSGMPYFGSVAPAGWLLCDGAAVSRTTYAALLAVIGDVYKRYTTLATRTSDTAGTVDLGAGHGVTAGSATLTLRFVLAASTISAVNTTTDVITTTAAHFLDTGDKIRVSSTATLPTGLVAATDYYGRFVSATTLTLHTSLAGAQGNTNLVNLTGAGTGTRIITPQDEGVRSGMTVDSVVGDVLTLSAGTGHILPSTTTPIVVEAISGLFFLPDLRGQSVVGAGQGVGRTNRVLGTSLGEEMHQLTIAEMPSHRHASASTAILIGSASGSYYTGGSSGTTMVMPLEGGNQPHNTMPPSLVANYIIKT